MLSAVPGSSNCTGSSNKNNNHNSFNGMQNVHGSKERNVNVVHEKSKKPNSSRASSTSKLKIVSVMGSKESSVKR